ncbi:MAG: SRPBCC domain-containing protein [Actinobacteria bacterium]|nr:SRPBCC domain-containing protein [Actinomycetota bacterium]
MSNLAHTVKRTVLLDAPPDRVWEALVDPALLSEWLAPEVELDPREGGEVVCRFADGEERRGEVAVVEEAERLAFTWRREEGGESWVEWTLDAVAAGTRLTVIETATPAGPMLLAAGGARWARRLASLDLVLGRLVLA